jgi:hypothetical protein
MWIINLKLILEFLTVRYYHFLLIALKCKKMKINGSTIDKSVQELSNKEKDHCKNVLHRIIAIIKILGKNNLAF